MKILLISSRYLPIFNKENRGAIQKLEQIYLKYNETTDDHFTVYSPKIAADNFDCPNLKNTTFRIVDQTTIKYKIAKNYHAAKRIILWQQNSEQYIRTVANDIVKRNEQNKYDLILFENGEQDIPIFKKLTETQTRIVLHLHNDYINTDTKNSKKIINSCDEIWTVSNFLAKRINAVKKAETITIPNAIDTNNFKVNSQKIKSLSEKYNTKSNKIFIFVGRILKRKGVLQLLKAFNEYNQNNPNAKLLIIGSAENNKEGKHLQKTLASYCTNNRNIHHLGYLKPNELVNYQTIADCQIIPSMCEEAFGLVILEAMASNLKIIASRTGGIPEIGENKIIYVNRKTIVDDLIREMQKISKEEKLPEKHYQELLDKYTIKIFCNNIYNAIHEKEE